MYIHIWGDHIYIYMVPPYMYIYIYIYYVCMYIYIYQLIGFRVRRVYSNIIFIGFRL